MNENGSKKGAATRTIHSSDLGLTCHHNLSFTRDSLLEKPKRLKLIKTY
jgi:hypothetical protein